MVKTGHPIETISGRISSSDGRRIPLVRTVEANTQVGSRTSVDPTSATMQALAAPLDFPALSLSTVPGDRVAIAVDESVPCAAQVVRGVVDGLHSAGVDDDAISIVTTSSEFGRQCRAALDNEAASAIHSVTHDPEDEINLCMVAVRKRREPLRVNRTIFDADVVLPIGCARLDGCGAYDSLFPSFSDAEAVNRYRTPAGHESANAHDDMIRETKEAGRLIGAPLVVIVVPVTGESVAEVVAGNPSAVTTRSTELCRRQWEFHVPQRASLVIANVGGGAASQTWANVGRALAAAERLVAEDGAIAICTNLEQPPGQSLGRLIGCSDLSAARRKIAHEHSDDSWPAWRLAGALERGPVYFLSQLDADTVEEMGMAPVESVDELVRLASRNESVIAIDDAQLVSVTVDDEDDERS